MDYCTAGPQYASGGFIADSRLPATHQRLAAAVADPQQRGRRAGPTACGTRSSPACVGAPDDAGVPEPAVHHAGHHPGQPGEAVPVRRRARPVPASACPPRGTNTSGVSWADGHDAGPHDPARRLLRRQAVATRCGRSTASSRAASTCCSPRACTTSRAASRSSGPTRWCSASGTPRSPRSTARPRSTSPTCPASIVAGVTIDAGPQESPVLLRVGTQARPRTQLAAQPDHTVRRVLPGRRPARRQDRHRAGGQQRQRAHRPHLGVAGRPRRRGLHRHRSAGSTNTGRNGAVINGDHVTATGLFVEHFQQYNTVWNGERRHDDPLPERAAVRPADAGRLDERRRRGLGRLQGRRPGAHPHAVRRRGVRVQPEQPGDPHRERLRGAATGRACGCTTS